MKRISLLAASLLVLTGMAIAGLAMAGEEEDISSAKLVQFAADMMGDTNQDARVSGFDIADSRQIGYSSDRNVTQTVYYENIGNGNIIQWGESGNMPREERTLFLDSAGDSGFTWQWKKGDVNQSINVRNSGNLYLKQIIGGLKKILFPDPQNQQEQSGNWWFCGKPAHGRGGLPLCSEKIARKIFDGKANPRDYYMLKVIEEDYNVFPSDNVTPHVTLTKWNITRVNDNLTIKFYAHNFGKRTYNATFVMVLVPRINISDIDWNTGRSQAKGNTIELSAAGEGFDGEIKVPEKQRVEIGVNSVPSMHGIEREIEVPLNGMKIKNMEMKMVSE